MANNKKLHIFILKLLRFSITVSIPDSCKNLPRKSIVNFYLFNLRIAKENFLINTHPRSEEFLSRNKKESVHKISLSITREKHVRREMK